MRPNDATPAPFSQGSGQLIAVPIALAILVIRNTSRVALAAVVAGMAVAFIALLLATPLHAARRHDAEQRRIFYALCLYGSSPRQCAIAAGYRP